jgi:hypothetical protein
MEKKKQDRLTALIFVTIGSVFAFASVYLSSGTWHDIDPGRWPLICSITLMVVGSLLWMRK